MKTLLVFSINCFVFFFCLNAQEQIPTWISEQVSNCPPGTEFAIGIITPDTTFLIGVKQTAEGLIRVANENAIFEIGSITKTFTANLIMKQVQEGRIDLAAPIENYLPIPIPGNQYEGHKINVQHLLTHSSTLSNTPSTYTLPYLKALLFSPKNPNKNFKAKHYYRYLKDFSLDTIPGFSWNYNNSAYGLLGEMLAHQTGKSWAIQVQEAIFQPLGMQDTYLRIPKAVEHRFVPRIDADGKQNTKTWDMHFIDPAGTIKSTLADMLKYAKAQLSVSNSDLGFIQLSQAPLSYTLAMPVGTLWEGNTMGLGWWHNQEQGAEDFIWHGGSTDGHTSFIGFSPKTKTAVVVLSNLSANHPAGRAERNIPIAIYMGQNKLRQPLHSF
jgi:CubicO group peptidase (beta-lactamase class C family)